MRPKRRGRVHAVARDRDTRVPGTWLTEPSQSSRADASQFRGTRREGTSPSLQQCLPSVVARTTCCPGSRGAIPREQEVAPSFTLLPATPASLVPRLRLGTHLSARLRRPATDTPRAPAVSNPLVPKLHLGTRLRRQLRRRSPKSKRRHIKKSAIPSRLPARSAGGAALPLEGQRQTRLPSRP